MARHQIYNLVCGKCSVAKTRAGDLRRFIKPHLEGRLRKVPAYGVRTSPLAACNLRIDGEDRRRAERRAKRFHTSAGRELSAIETKRRELLLVFGNDPSAGSPTETLLRLLLPLDDQV